MPKKKLKAYEIIGICCSVTLYLIILHFYATANLDWNGLNCIMTNHYGEYYPEIIMLIVGFACFIYFIYEFLKERIRKVRPT